MDITILYYIAGVILFLFLRSRVNAIKREREVVAKMQEYIENNSKFIKIDKIEETGTPLYIAYNYLTNDFVAQGSTIEEVKTNASLKWPKFDIFVVTLE